MTIGDEIHELIIVERGIIEVFTSIDGNEFVYERLFKGSIINYKSIFTKGTAMVNVRFVTEGIVKVISMDTISQLRRKNKRFDRDVSKFELKVARLTTAPLDYILSLPKQVYEKMLKRQKERLIFKKQEYLMAQLNLAQEEYFKWTQQHMDDFQISQKLKELQADAISREEEIFHVTKILHLQLRIKNVAAVRLYKMQVMDKQADMKQILKSLTKLASKSKLNSLMR